MTETQVQIEKLRTLQESYDAVADAVENQLPALADKIDNIDLTPIENKVDEGVSTLSAKIDNIKLPEIDTTELAKEATLNAVSSKLDNLNVEVDLSDVAKQGDNQEATNSAIYALLSQFGESVLQEAVTVICNCAEDIAWEEYGIVITYADGTSQSLPMSENGTCSFSVKIGQEYSVQLPVIGAYIVPAKKTYTASTSSRQIYWSYVVTGVFGVDELGRRYTIKQIEALEDKSIIIAGGYTDEALESSMRDDGTTGNGFMWDIHQEGLKAPWASSDVEFSQDLLPFVTSESLAMSYCNGEAYTRYMVAEATRLLTSSPAATLCQGRTLTTNSITKNGYLPAYGQIRRLALNITSFYALYTALGLTAPTINGGRWWTSCQNNATNAVHLFLGGFNPKDNLKTSILNVLCCFDL